MSGPGDFQLVERCLNGETEAFASIVDKYGKTIFNIVLRMINDYENSQDVTQIVFVKAFEKLDTFNPRYKFFSWLYKIAFNESLNFLKLRRDHVKLDDAAEAIVTKAVDEVYDQKERHDLLHNSLMELEPEHRMLIVLRHFNNLSYQEIAETLEVPERIVKSRLFTARTTLREVLLKKGITL